VYAISDGIVISAKNLKGGWGNVVRIYHNYGTKQQPLYIESLYAHLNSITVTPKTVIKRGDKIGTIGNVNGLYLAHLHLEIRDKINQPIGKGYAKETHGYSLF
jgi:murein DD-endopeptidase MepM/ murein hydrolase activator NlpD